VEVKQAPRGADALSGITALKEHSPRWVKDSANAATRAFALGTAASRPAPDFLIIGTKRGGTTSLFNYLLMHPGVLGLFPQSRGKKSTDYFFKELDRGERWYRSHYHARSYRNRLARSLGHQPVGGEASPYYMWDPRIARHAYQVSPQIRAIAVLRDPVERAWSHYQERVQNGVEPLSFAAALEAEPARTSGELELMAADPLYYSEAHDFYTYRARGLYLTQLTNWTSVFPRDQLLVIRSEDMYLDPQAAVDDVCEFLRIPRVALPSTRTFNASGRSSMPVDARRELTRYYAPFNEELEEFLGRPMGWAT
jgi:Sulfotransferase domain